jgi:hypothetical protein
MISSIRAVALSYVWWVVLVHAILPRDPCIHAGIAEAQAHVASRRGRRPRS